MIVWWCGITRLQIALHRPFNLKVISPLEEWTDTLSSDYFCLKEWQSVDEKSVTSLTNSSRPVIMAFARSDFALRTLSLVSLMLKIVKGENMTSPKKQTKNKI